VVGQGLLQPSRQLLVKKGVARELNSERVESSLIAAAAAAGYKNNILIAIIMV